MDEQYKKELLETTLKARIQEVTLYQVNIDNYTLAIEEINSLPESDQVELNDFKAQLNDLLVSEKLEQKKAKIMLSIIRSQVG